MDRDYRVTAKTYGVTIQKVKGDDLADFRIERARFRSSGYLITLAITTIIGYGWALDRKVVRRPQSPQYLQGLNHTNLKSAFRGSFGSPVFHRRLYNRSFQYLRHLAHRHPSPESSNCAGFLQHCSLRLIRRRSFSATGNDCSSWARLDLYCLRRTVHCNNSNDSGRDPVGTSMAPETKYQTGSSKRAAGSPNNPGSCSYLQYRGRTEVQAKAWPVSLLVGVQPAPRCNREKACKNTISVFDSMIQTHTALDIFCTSFRDWRLTRVRSPLSDANAVERRK